MKSKDVGATVTNNDELVRLRIFDGVIPPDDYHREMYELERGQHQATRDRLRRVQEALDGVISEKGRPSR